jgi:hypothetical protein
MRIPASSFPAIYFAGELVPLIPFLKHEKVVLRWGPKVGEVPNCTEVIIRPPGSVEFISGELLFLPYDRDVRKLLKISDIYIVYDHTAEVLACGLLNGKTQRDADLMQKITAEKFLADTKTLKVVSYITYKEIYRLITGRQAEDNDPDWEFIIKRKFITPNILIRMNQTKNIFLPYRIWIEIEDDS